MPPPSPRSARRQQHGAALGDAAADRARQRGGLVVARGGPITPMTSSVARGGAIRRQLSSAKRMLTPTRLPVFGLLPALDRDVKDRVPRIVDPDEQQQEHAAADGEQRHGSGWRERRSPEQSSDDTRQREDGAQIQSPPGRGVLGPRRARRRQSNVQARPSTGRGAQSPIPGPCRPGQGASGSPRRAAPRRSARPSASRMRPRCPSTRPRRFLGAEDDHHEHEPGQRRRRRDDDDVETLPSGEQRRQRAPHDGPPVSAEAQVEDVPPPGRHIQIQAGAGELVARAPVLLLTPGGSPAMTSPREPGHRQRHVTLPLRRAVVDHRQQPPIARLQRRRRTARSSSCRPRPGGRSGAATRRRAPPAAAAPRATARRRLANPRRRAHRASGRRASRRAPCGPPAVLVEEVEPPAP